MKTRAIIMAVTVALLAATAWAGEVSQGRLVSADPASAIYTLEEFDTHFSAENPYGAPTGIVSTFDVATAKIGIHPEPGDILRIAYEENGEHRKAMKVMNVSKQDLRKQ